MANLVNLINEHSLLTIILLAFFSFSAGFIDAVVGGGGLVIMPFLLINFPRLPLPVLFGTNKISALCGTSISAFKYAQQLKFNFGLLLVVSFFAFFSSYIGAVVVNLIDPKLLKPFLLIILVLIATYTFFKKDLGSKPTKELSIVRQMIFGSLIGLVVGFYDGFFGPGTGSFFVLGFVVILGFEFVQASAYSKVVNCITNISALIVFIRNGQFILEMALLMAAFNILGSYMGASIALKRGNDFIRKIFLLIVGMMILKYGYDVFSVNTAH